MRVLLLALLAFPAHAQDTATIGLPMSGTGPSVVHLAPSDKPGALAEFTFRNEMVNDGSQTGARTVLRIPGLEVGVTFFWNSDLLGSDAVTLDVPEGVLCVPSCTLVVPEGDSGMVVLYSHEGVGA